jgi:hypothetical protein
MKKLISLFQDKYEQILLWVLTRATEILLSRYEAKLKKNQKQVSVTNYAKAISQPQNSWAAEELKKRKEKYDSLPQNKEVRISFQSGNWTKKEQKLKLDFPCEKLWQAVFGEQEKFTFAEYESKKDLLNSELQKLFKACKTKNEVDETYRDLTFKNRFAKMISKSLVCENDPAIEVLFEIDETKLTTEIEKVKSERLDFLEKNTKTEIIKVCDCCEDCYCGSAERTILLEDGEEIVLFDNMEKMKKHNEGRENYENLGLEIEEYGSEKKSTFSVNQDEIVLFLSESSCVASSSNFEYEKYKFKLPIHQFTIQQLKKAKNEIEEKYNKSWIKYSKLIVNYQTGKSNLIYIIKDPSQEMPKNLIKIAEEQNFTYKAVAKTPEPTEQDLENLKEIITEVCKDPDYKIISKRFF